MMEIKCFKFNFLPVNTYLLWDETGQAAIIDPGCYYPNESDTLAQFIKEHELTVKLLLNTHLHFDHIFGNSFVEERYSVKAHANELDAPWIETLSARLALFGIEFKGYVNAIEPQNYIHDGDILTFGNTTLHALHIPGHSPGSIVFWNQEQEVLFTGDVLFKGGYGRTDFPDGSQQSLFSGIRSKLLVMPSHTIVYPGHGVATTIGNERGQFI